MYKIFIKEKGKIVAVTERQIDSKFERDIFVYNTYCKFKGRYVRIYDAYAEVIL